MFGKIWASIIMFLTGGIIYFYFEILMRGYSHISMFVLGGLCFFIVGYIGNEVVSASRNRLFTIIVVMVISAVVITTLELVTGMIVNIKMNLNVWDYSEMKMNYMGQICVLYSCVWAILGLPCVYFYGLLDKFVLRNIEEKK